MVGMDPTPSSTGLPQDGVGFLSKVILPPVTMGWDDVSDAELAMAPPVKTVKTVKTVKVKRGKKTKTVPKVQKSHVKKKTKKDASGPAPWPKPKQSAAAPVRILSLGTDFSGLETPSQALGALGVPFDLKFSAEIQPHLRKFIRRNFTNHGKIYKDVAKRSVEKMPYVDVYVAGPPCQPWSAAGKLMGLHDMKGRGILLYECLKYINLHKPKVVVLENVANLTSGRFKEEFGNLCNILRLECGYDIQWQRLDTLHHGVPQSRPRVYIVAFLRSMRLVQPFEFPGQLPHCVKVSKVMTRRNTVVTVRPHASPCAQRNINKAKAECPDFDTQHVFVDVDAGEKFAHWVAGHLPCLTASRGASSGFYLSTYNRRLTMNEMMRFQGMNPQVLAGWQECMTERQMGHAIGNAMSVNVLQRVLLRALAASGLVGNIQDPWDNKDYTPWQDRKLTDVVGHTTK